MSGCNDGSDIIRGPCLDYGLGKYSGVGNARCAHNYYHKIQFAVFRDQSAVIRKSVQIKYRCPVTKAVDEFAVAVNPCRTIEFVKSKREGFYFLITFEMTDISCADTVFAIDRKMLI